MNTWYKKYESQCWYKNTFLVNKFTQISKVDKRNGEWNNIYGSGCHFVCLSMIIGINPAYLSSELKKLNFFSSDRSLKSKNLKGNKTFLVWDKNEPHNKYKDVTIPNVLHSELGLVDVSINFIEIIKTNSISDANKLIKENRSKGNHIICGYEDHSRLVAGTNNSRYFLWDPDLDETDITKNINGKYSLEWFYEIYKNEKDYSKKIAEYWVYSVKYKNV